MKAKLVFTKKAQKELGRLDAQTRKRIAIKLQYYLEQEKPLEHARPLVHSSLGSFRFRVGHYRIAFDKEGSKYVVVSVIHRKNAYKK
ncbi:hypothetical protein MNBD_BACTEROID07-1679 [hydrothermal vent metagenome]|uniref:RelE/StbE replicon stabilization toxin n=1 Tax=hydrothermal vent metagenome TaxID=652676 RepID=A0A3B0U9P7_9ZZZZ